MLCVIVLVLGSDFDCVVDVEDGVGWMVCG